MYEENTPAVANFQAPAASTALATIEQSRAVAEVQAALVLARANPRNEQLVIRSVTDACKRPTLAESAEYVYVRGGTQVVGPTIRLAEVLARAWGNVEYGFREVGRGADFSEVEAFCYDYQTNTKVTRQFQVRHWRDKKGGGAALTEERDKYEMVANQAQRRVRACILEVVPGDITDMAVEACRATLGKEVGNIEEAVPKMLSAFEAVGVTQEEIEDYLQRSVKSIVPADIVNLRRVMNSIKQGVASKDEFFKRPEKKVDPKGKKLGESFSQPPKPEQPSPVAPRLQPSPEQEDPPADGGDEPSPAQKGAFTKLSKELMAIPGSKRDAGGEAVCDALDLWMADNYDRAAAQCHVTGVEDLKRLHMSLRGEFSGGE